MRSATDHDERIANMTFASVYPLYLAKVEKKGRTEEELHQILKWLTGFNSKTLQKHIDNKITFEHVGRNWMTMFGIGGHHAKSTSF